eukprot:m.438480 g.438480  ORF g.438480 m.438480 type:complete len:196 (+) comp21445_c0_seq11:581-1168(+)
MGRGIHGHPSLALYSTIDAIICEPYVTTSLPWSCGCLVHCEQLKRQLAESQKEKEAIQKKNKAQLSRMAQKVFARLQGNEEGLREQEEERRELKEWEVEAARKAKENEMEAERLREEANRAARKANERRLEAERMHAEAKRNEAEARRRADEQEQARRDKEASEEAERQRMCGYTTTPPRGCTHRHHSSDNTNTQ